jgi:hypothetical protein
MEHQRPQWKAHQDRTTFDYPISFQFDAATSPRSSMMPTNLASSKFAAMLFKSGNKYLHKAIRPSRTPQLPDEPGSEG